MQPGMVVCELHSATIFGVPFMLLRQATAGFESLTTPATDLIWLSPARGVRRLTPAGAGWAAVMPGTTVIWLPAARGESSASAANEVKVNAATAAPRRN